MVFIHSPKKIFEVFGNLKDYKTLLCDDKAGFCFFIPVYYVSQNNWDLILEQSSKEVILFDVTL
jgi:hypothetical protein